MRFSERMLPVRILQTYDETFLWCCCFQMDEQDMELRGLLGLPHQGFSQSSSRQRGFRLRLMALRQWLRVRVPERESLRKPLGSKTSLNVRFDFSYRYRHKWSHHTQRVPLNSLCIQVAMPWWLGIRYLRLPTFYLVWGGGYHKGNPPCKKQLFSAIERLFNNISLVVPFLDRRRKVFFYLLVGSPRVRNFP